MRVVGGTLRGRPLHPPPASAAATLRPTGDRVRESIFNLLAHGTYGNPPPPTGQRVLDLFAGTGALGIEALSRGAQHCVFVESDPAARALIRRNLETLDLIGAARVFRRDATRLGRATGPPFELVLLDPPYAAPAAGAAALEAARRGGWVGPAAVAVLEGATATEPPAPRGWTPVSHRTYGTTQVTILRATA